MTPHLKQGDKPMEMLKKANKAIGDPYTGGLVQWEDIQDMENLKGKTVLYHVVRVGNMKLIVAGIML